jgi:hypothetical protein
MTHMPPEPATLHVALPEQLLPAGHTLALHKSAGLLACLAPGPEGVGQQLVEAARLSGEEVRVLGSLLTRAPLLCPYAIALAWLIYPSPTEDAVARCRQRLELARQGGYWEEEMALLRGILSTLKDKLQVLGLTIAAVLETGYVLQPYRPPGGDHPGEGERQP